MKDEPIIAKPAITRLARQAGVKSLADDCIPTIRKYIKERIEKYVESATIINSVRSTKTLMTDDMLAAIRSTGRNIAFSDDLGTSTCTKYYNITHINYIK